MKRFYFLVLVSLPFSRVYIAKGRGGEGTLLVALLILSPSVFSFKKMRDGGSPSLVSKSADVIFIHSFF